MKKLFKLFTLVLMVMFLVCCNSCSSKFDSEEIDAAIELTFKDVDLKSVTTDLEFSSKIGNCDVKYHSNKESVISNTGKVTRTSQDENVTITVDYTFKDITASKDFKVIVLKKEQSEQLPTIKEVKNYEAGTTITLEGYVAVVINGTEKNIPVGFYFIDSTDAIYVYSPSAAENVKKGDKLRLQGTFTCYIAESDVSSALKAGYTGARQIELSSFEVLSSNNPIDLSFANDTAISELVKIPVSTNITSNLYNVTCNIHKSQGNGFVNYYFNDLNGVNSYYAYTTSNGKDLSWLEQYDGQVRNCVIAIQNCKLSASGNFWRIVPIFIGDEVIVSDEEYAEYALDRLEMQFEKQYQSSATISLLSVEELSGATVSYKSLSENLEITENDGQISANIKFVANSQMELEMTIVYNDITVTRKVVLQCGEGLVKFDTITIAEARKLASGEEATIEGYIVGFLYLKGTSKPAGFELVDGTTSIAVICSTDTLTQTDASKYIIGEYIVVTGKVDLYQPRLDNNHTGSIRINNAEVIFNDHESHELPTESIEEIDFQDLVNNPSDNNISNVAYLTTFFVERTTGSYINYYIHDLEDPSLSMIVYSQNSDQDGPDEYKWLDQYAGKCVKGYITLRIGAVSNKKFVWKSGVLQVLEVVETPATVSAYLKQGIVKGLFATEYTKESSIQIDVATNEQLSVNSSSTQVTSTFENGKLVINIAHPITSEAVTLNFEYIVDGKIASFTISFNIVKTELMTLAEFRESAKKSGGTVEVEGIVTALTKFKGSSTWAFYISDGTGTIYCKTQAAVAVGDKVNISGPMDLYYGLPQIGSKAEITILSSGNELPVSSFVQNATINDLIEANNAGEAGKMGAIYYTNIVATLHISKNRCYISVYDKEIDLYNYTNANYYAANYEQLEEYDGLTVVLDLVSYNLYNNQYTYVIAGLKLN